MGRVPDKMPIKKQELDDFIKAKSWSVIYDEDNGPEPSFFHTPWGMTRVVVDKAPEDGLSLRLKKRKKR